jgi:hypothetical protein
MMNTGCGFYRDSPEIRCVRPGSGGTIYVDGNPDSGFVNNGNFQITGDNSMIGTEGFFFFDNNGRIPKTFGNGVTYIGAIFNGTGTIIAQTGSITTWGQ